jgi:hypothetical protein
MSASCADGVVACWRPRARIPPATDLLELGEHRHQKGRIDQQAGGNAGLAIYPAATRAPSRRVAPGGGQPGSSGGVQVKSRYNAAAVGVHGIEPPYQAIRTIELQYGRLLNWQDEGEARRVA